MPKEGLENDFFNSQKVSVSQDEKTEIQRMLLLQEYQKRTEENSMKTKLWYFTAYTAYISAILIQIITIYLMAVSSNVLSIIVSQVAVFVIAFIGLVIAFSKISPSK